MVRPLDVGLCDCRRRIAQARIQREGADQQGDAEGHNARAIGQALRQRQMGAIDADQGAGNSHSTRTPIAQQPRQQARAEHRDDRPNRPGPALLHHEPVLHVLLGAQGEDGERQAKGHQRRKARIHEGAGDVRAIMILLRGHGQTFSTSGRPSRPWGMKIRVMASTEKAATSL